MPSPWTNLYVGESHPQKLKTLADVRAELYLRLRGRRPSSGSNHRRMASAGPAIAYLPRLHGTALRETAFGKTIF